MNANQILSTARQILGFAAIIIASIAVLKLAGIGVPVRGGVMELAAVAIACGLAK